MNRPIVARWPSPCIRSRTMDTTNPTNTPKKTPIHDSVERALAELETITEEIELKIHLASMDAKTVWKDTLEPKLHEARTHARGAKDASKAVIEDAVKAFEKFAAAL